MVAQSLKDSLGRASKPYQDPKLDEAETIPFPVPENASQRLFPGEEWPTFVAFVGEKHQASQRAMKRLAGSKTNYRTPSWDFVRGLKTHPKLADLSPWEAGEHVHNALMDFYEQDKDDLLWERLSGDTDTRGDAIDPWADFLNAWGKCRAMGTGDLERVVAAVRADPKPGDYFDSRLDGGPFSLSGIRYERFREFLTVAEALQQLASEEEPIFLAVEPIAKALGTSKMNISRWRSLGQACGLLVEVSEGTRGKAAEFFFIMPK